MKKKILAALLSASMLASLAACSDSGNQSSSGSQGNSAVNSGSTASTNTNSAAGSDAGAGPEGFNATGMPIMNEKITLRAWIEGGADTDFSQNELLKRWADTTNIQLEIVSTPTADALQKRNLMFASGDYTDILLTDWNAMVSKTDAMQYGVKEGILLPVTSYIDTYGNNIKKIFEQYPHYKESCIAPNGEIYGLARFSECYHCSAYPKVYLRQDWMDTLNLQMPDTTEDLRNVLKAFVENDPNGNGKKDEIGMIGATTWNTMVEYALIGMSFQTVKPDFWLSLGADGQSVEFAPSTEAYREGLRYVKSLYDEGLIDKTSFTQKEDQMAQTVRTEPHIVGMYVCDHAGMGYDNNDPAEAEKYQIMIPVAGPSGFRRQGQNANEGEVRGFHAVITDACEYPEAAFRFVDEIFYDDDMNMQRFYGDKGVGWDYAPDGTKNVFGDTAKYVIMPATAEEKDARKNTVFGYGPSADLAPFRLSMLPEVENVYLGENYEQRITLDTKKVEPYIPEKRLQSSIFVPLDSMDEYAEIQANLNSFVRMATVQFIMGERDIESGWDQYLKELDSYKVNRYIEIYKSSGAGAI